jgi:hypothetical protein
MATIRESKDKAVMYSTHSRDNGLKLMEHSYLENNYCKHIMSLLKNNPLPLIWLCDYHEADETTDLTWDLCEEDETDECIDSFTDDKYFILNHTKKVFIDVEKLFKLYGEEAKEEWYIHPIPILCNSDTQSLGGGDYHPEDSRRATWCEDIISTSQEPEGEYKDVTEDVLFFEGR